MHNYIIIINILNIKLIYNIIKTFNYCENAEIAFSVFPDHDHLSSFSLLYNMTFSILVFHTIYQFSSIIYININVI